MINIGRPKKRQYLEAVNFCFDCVYYEWTIIDFTIPLDVKFDDELVCFDV